MTEAEEHLVGVVVEQAGRIKELEAKIDYYRDMWVAALAEHAALRKKHNDRC